MDETVLHESAFCLKKTLRFAEKQKFSERTLCRTDYVTTKSAHSQIAADVLESVVREKKERMNWNCEEKKKKVCCAWSTPRMWETMDERHCSWKRTGMQFVRLSALALRSQNGKSRTTSTWRCTQWSRRQGRCGCWKSWKKMVETITTQIVSDKIRVRPQYGALWKSRMKSPTVALDEGETKFGQDQVWPDQVWPRPSLARPSLAKTKVGQTQCGTINIVRCVKASPAEGRRRLHTNTAYVRLSFQRAFMWSIAVEGPKAGVLAFWGLGVKGLGFRSLGFRSLGFRSLGL